jgi:hypothetical protein
MLIQTPDDAIGAEQSAIGNFLMVDSGVGIYKVEYPEKSFIARKTSGRGQSYNIMSDKGV